MTMDFNFPTFDPKAPMFGVVDPSVGMPSAYDEMASGMREAMKGLFDDPNQPQEKKETPMMVEKPSEVLLEKPTEVLDVTVKEPAVLKETKAEVIPEASKTIEVATPPETLVEAVIETVTEVIVETPKPPVVKPSGLEFIPPVSRESTTPQELKSFQSVPVDPENKEVTDLATSYLKTFNMPEAFIAEFEKQALIYGVYNLEVTLVSVAAANPAFSCFCDISKQLLTSNDFGTKSNEFLKQKFKTDMESDRAPQVSIETEEDVLNLAGSARRLNRKAVRRKGQR